MSFIRNVNSIVGFLLAVILLMPGCTNFGSAVLDLSSGLLPEDTTAPTISFLTPDAYTAGDTNISISGSCESGLTVSIAGTGAVSQSVACSGGSFGATVTFSAGQGVKEISVSQTDGAGNVGTATREFLRTTSMYYVSAAGSDTNTGRSPSDAFQTIAKINSLTLAPGDVVGFRSGDTFNGTLNLTTSGTSGSPISIISYGASRATINAGTASGIYAHNVGYIVIHNINVSSPDRTLNSGSGVSFLNDQAGNTKLNYVRINKVTASGFGQSGISVGGWASDNSKSGYNDVRITNVIATDNGLAGVNVFGFEDDTVATYANSNVYVGRTIAHNNPGIPGHGNNSGNGIVISNVDTGTIEYSVAYENGTLHDNATVGPVGIWAWASTGIKIQFNESHHNSTTTVDGGGFDLDGGMKNSVMQYNYSHNNKGPGFMVYQYSTGAGYDMTNLTVRYNISENDGVGSSTYGAAYVAAAPGTTITGPVWYYNNTFYSDATVTGTPTRLVYTNTNNTEFRYNIFVVNGGTKFFDVVQQTGQLFRGNNYWAVDGTRSMLWGGTPYSTILAWRNATGQETDSTADASSIVDPLLVNPGAGITLNSLDGPKSLTSYKLQPLSAMIDTGEDISSVVGNMGNIDFFGNPTPARTFHDRGACEAP